MKILITGAFGFVGRAVVRRLCAGGHRLRAAVRHDLESSRAETVRVGNIDGGTDWRAALEGVEAVVHLAARVHVMRSAADDALDFRLTNTDGTLRLAQSAVAAGVRRFVFTSSIKVNGDGTTGGAPFTADDVPAPSDPYAVSKSEAEKALLSTRGIDAVIIRPPLVYGPGVKGNLARLCGLAFAGIPVPFACIDNRRDLIGVDNLADLISCCVEHPVASGKVFLASDDCPLSTPQLYGMIAAAMGRRPRMFAVPSGLLRVLGRWLGRRDEIERLVGSLELDTSKTQELLSWSPPFQPEQGVASMVDAYLADRTGSG